MNEDKLAIAFFCRGYLYFNGLLSESENDKVHKRFLKFQHKHKIELTEEDLDSVEITRKAYKDKYHE